MAKIYLNAFYYFMLVPVYDLIDLLIYAFAGGAPDILRRLHYAVSFSPSPEKAVPAPVGAQ